MQLINILPLLAIAAAASSGQPDPQSAESVDYVDKFDDRAAMPISVGDASAVGVYHALNYAGFSLARPKLPTDKQPPSPPNFIYHGPTSSSQAEFLPANSSVQYFDLKSVYNSCAAIGGVSSPSCTIQVAGRKAPRFGGSTAVQELVYDGELLNGTFNFTSFPSTFDGLVEVSISVIASSLPLDVVLPRFDNVAYTAHIAK